MVTGLVHKTKSFVLRVEGAEGQRKGVKKGRSEKRGRTGEREGERERDLDHFNSTTIFKVPSSLEVHMTESWMIYEDFLLSN